MECESRTCGARAAARPMAEVADNGKPFEEKMKRLVATLDEQFAESAKLEKAIRGNLRELGHGS